MGLFDFFFGGTLTNWDMNAITNAIFRGRTFDSFVSKECEDWDWHPNYKPKLYGEFKMYARIESEISRITGYTVRHPLDTPHWLEQEHKLKGIEIAHKLLADGIINQHMHDVAVEILIDSYQAREHGYYTI